MEARPYKPEHQIRFVTATSLFDGHDAAINIMRRILQSSGAEVIHLGHNRSASEVVKTAIEEDVQGVALSSYQGGHIEYFKYVLDLLRDAGAPHIKVFGGGGGVIVPDEIAELERYGVTKIFSPDDGMGLGLQGMIDLMIRACDFQTPRAGAARQLRAARSHLEVARRLSTAEQRVLSHALADASDAAESSDMPPPHAPVPVIGVTGTGGAGKSTLTDELIRRFLNDFDDLHLAVLSVDPTRRKTGGALLGDRIRMNALYGEHADRVYMRSFATREANRSTSRALAEAVAVCRAAEFDLIFVETAGIGQSDTEIADLADLSVYVMTQEFGAPTQLEKIGMLDAADIVVLNKFEKRGSEDALREIRKQIRRNQAAFSADLETMPVFPAMASHFDDPGVSRVYLRLLDALRDRFEWDRHSHDYEWTHLPEVDPADAAIIPPARQRYLGEVADACRSYRHWVENQVDLARRWGQAHGAAEQVSQWDPEDADLVRRRLDELTDHTWDRLDERCRKILSEWDAVADRYRAESLAYQVRGHTIEAPLTFETLSGTRIPRVALPRTQDPGERLRFALLEGLPGYFPYTAGVFPFKRRTEDPTRMFAGEGSPERTNRRFHLVSEGMPARRLSTAFDSVTLYGFDPAERPDIYGKVGNAGVSICTLDDMKKLFSGFDLCSADTSVSMTINGPAPMILAMFMNAAIDQQVELHLRRESRWEAVEQAIRDRLGARAPVYVPYGPEGLAGGLPRTHDGSGLGLLGTSGEELVTWGLLDEETYQRLKKETLRTVRGTVQADILKEDQAQNTCIFSTEFALRLMGDVQQYFIDHEVRNYYSVSISGYHIAEAGANPITQLAFTLANGFTYAEYYRARGMDVNAFAPNLSFFFSNGMDAEYTVLGRVARRIWSVAMARQYGANERSQKLKYHIQTSGRSLHAREINFNDIRTTLQALLAFYDNCNSLHTNAYDEAITTPTEESVRRAMAIQLIIGRELGLARNENPLQGAFIVDELTDLVEEAVLAEFDRLNDRGGVLGAMETMYQRGRIQEESLLYEAKKHTGDVPIVGVNVFVPENGRNGEVKSVQLMRSSEEEKQHQLQHLREFQQRHDHRNSDALQRLRARAMDGGNVFEELMDTVKYCSLGQITSVLFSVGGAYRRNM